MQTFRKPTVVFDLVKIIINLAWIIGIFWVLKEKGIIMNFVMKLRELGINL